MTPGSPHLHSLSSIIQGPVESHTLDITMKDVYNNGSWDFSTILFQIPNIIRQSITSMAISVRDNNFDTATWNCSPDARFTTSNMYSLLSKQSPKVNHNDIYQSTFSRIWKANTPNKIRTFIWLLTHKRLLTSNYLHHIGIDVPTQCYFCNNDVENLSHMFFRCSNAFRFWTSIQAKSKNKFSPTWHNMEAWQDM